MQPEGPFMGASGYIALTRDELAGLLQERLVG
jgi:hypothetical protein